ncbi:MAG: hypothetical protein MJZ26_07785 [Fibrobacter sp.]|nr:hypothetical protein [Fibrobacter sp.]
MDIAVKITLVAAVVLIGYNLSQFLSSYESVCEKIKEFKTLAAESESDDSSVMKTNMFLTGTLSLTFVVLTYFSGFAPWVVALLAFKMVVTVFLSHQEIIRILKNNEIDPGFFKVSKIDYLVNILTGIAVAVILVA